MPGASIAAPSRLASGRPSSASISSAADAAGPEQARHAVFDLDDGRFDAYRRRPAVDDEANAVAKIIRHRLRRRGADAARAVRAWRGDRPAETRDQPGGEAARHPQRDRVQSGGNQRVDAGAGPQRQDEGERPRPEFFGQQARQRIEDRDVVRHFDRADMGDQRVEARPAFRLEDARHRLPAGGVAGQPVYRLGRHGDDLAGGKQRQRRIHRVARGNHFSHQLSTLHRFARAIMALTAFRPRVPVRGNVAVQASAWNSG